MCKTLIYFVFLVGVFLLFPFLRRLGPRASLISVSFFFVFFLAITQLALTPRTTSYISLIRAPLPVNQALGVLSPNLASCTGLSSLLPLWSADVPVDSILQRFSEALRALSVCLGSDAWFLGSM